VLTGTTGGFILSTSARNKVEKVERL